MTPNAREARLEQLIGDGRVVLGASCLVAIYLDPTEPARYAGLTYNLLAAYAVYALGLAIAIRSAKVVPPGVAVATHAVDLIAFTVFQYLTEAASSPFFTFFLFAFLVAVFRWHRRGLIWTVAVTVPAFVALGFVSEYVLEDRDFELNRFLMRATYLCLMAVFLGYAAAYDETRRRELRRLAIWSHSQGDTLDLALAHAGAALDARRVMLVWRDGDDAPERRATWSSAGDFTVSDAAGFLRQFEAVEEVDFLYTPRDGRTLVRTNSLEIGLVDTALVAPLVRSIAAGESVLGLRVRHGTVRGWLFAAAQSDPHPDNFFIGEMVARQLAVALDNERLSRHVRDHARVDERVRVARDLHDGVLQSLTGATFRMEALRRRPDAAPLAQDLQRIQDLVVAGQHDLRVFVNDLKRSDGHEGADLRTRLSVLRDQMKDRWGVELQLHMGEDVAPAVALAHDLYLIAHEAVVNAAKHGHASRIRLTVDRTGDALHVVIADNGKGFPFHGRYDHDVLAGQNLGPVSVRERVSALAGRVALDSSGTGARLDIVLPLSPS